MAAVNTPNTSHEPTIKGGYLKKKGGRMQQWTTRYFTLTMSTISYKLKQDSVAQRNTFDLVAGCHVTDIESKSRKLHTFWIVWPHDKKNKDHETNDGNNAGHNKPSQDSDDEQPADLTDKQRDLKQIVENEAQNQKRQKDKVAEQIELHHAHDQNVSLGTKVAAVAVGGVVVGALTAGIGLIPYFAVMGVAAVAGGGTLVFNWRKPLDSRLIIGCETLEEANEWRIAITNQIKFIEQHAKPSLPKLVDPKVVSNILAQSFRQNHAWKRVAIYEGMCVTEQDVGQARSSFSQSSVNEAVCRRAQMVLNATPTNAFLSLMSAKHWPKSGATRVVKEIDDHADLLGVTVSSNISIVPSSSNRSNKNNNIGVSSKGGSTSVNQRGSNIQLNKSLVSTVYNNVRSSPASKTVQVTRKMCLSRFWKYDDEGVYLLTFNSVHCDEFPAYIKKTKKGKFELCSKEDIPAIDAVITIAPRSDISDYDYDVPEALVTCIVQVSKRGNWLSDEEIEHFMDSFIADHLLELKYTLTCESYDLHYQDYSLSHYNAADSSTATTTATATATAASISNTGNDDIPVPIAVAASLNINTNTSNNTSNSTSGSSSAGRMNLSSKAKSSANNNANTNNTTTNSSSSSTSTNGSSNAVKRGVITMQPGAEEFQDSGNSHGHDDSLDKDKQHRTKGFMRMFSSKGKRDHKDGREGRDKDGRYAAYDDDAPDSFVVSSPHTSPKAYEHKHIVSGNASPSAPVRKELRFDLPSNTHSNSNSNNNNTYNTSNTSTSSNIERRQRRNSVANNLRGQIATTDYELQRLSKAIKKKVVIAQDSNAANSSSSQSNYVSKDEYSDLCQQQLDLQHKLHQLKQEYLQLTGESYDQSRGLGQRWRDFRTRRQLQHQQQHLQQQLQQQHQQSSSGNNNSTRGLPTIQEIGDANASNDLDSDDDNIPMNGDYPVTATAIASPAVSSDSDKDKQENFLRDLGRTRPAHWLQSLCTSKALAANNDIYYRKSAWTTFLALSRSQFFWDSLLEDLSQDRRRRILTASAVNNQWVFVLKGLVTTLFCVLCCAAAVSLNRLLALAVGEL